MNFSVNLLKCATLLSINKQLIKKILHSCFKIKFRSYLNTIKIYYSNIDIISNMS